MPRFGHCVACLVGSILVFADGQFLFEFFSVVGGFICVSFSLFHGADGGLFHMVQWFVALCDCFDFEALGLFSEGFSS